MKSTGFILSAVCLVTVFTSCLKSKDDAGPAQVFSWRIDNGTEQFSDSTNFLRLFGANMIYGKKGTTIVYVSMNANNPGLYSNTLANGSVGLTIAGTQYGCFSGFINITSNSNSRLNGTFNAEMIVSNVDTINLTGSFTNVRFY